MNNFLKGSAFTLGLMLMAACTNVDSPVIVEPEDPVISIDADLTSLVATDGWGQGGFAGSWAAPEVDTSDGRHSGMAEVYNGSNEGIAATGIIMQQKIEGLDNGLYIVELYANSLYTPNRGFDSDMADGATDVAFVFANEVKVPIVAKVAETTPENGLYTLEVNVTDGTLTLGLEKAKAGTNWHSIQIKSLTTTKEAHLSDLYAPLKAEAEALLSEKMSAETNATLAAALAEPMSQENMTALTLAIEMAKGSVASYKIIAAGVVPDDKLDYWTCTNGNTFHINTWSVEGNEGNDPTGMVTPFIENWVWGGDGTVLAEGEIIYCLPFLNPGEKYEVSALIRAYSEAGNDVSGLLIGGKDAAGSCRPFEYNNMKGIYGTVSEVVTVDEDGKLIFTIGIKNPTFNWVAIKNVKIIAK